MLSLAFGSPSETALAATQAEINAAVAKARAKDQEIKLARAELEKYEKENASDKIASQRQFINQLEQEYEALWNEQARLQREPRTPSSPGATKTGDPAPGKSAAEREADATKTAKDTADQFKFARNSLGKAGGKVADTIKACGSEAGRAGCEKVAKSIESYSHYSDYADYAGYAAVAGTILPAIVANPNQKNDLKNAATIQEVAGAVNIVAGAVDIGIGSQARWGEARKLEKIQQQEKRVCAAYAGSAKDLRAPASRETEQGDCARFRDGKPLGDAIDDVRGASNTHFLMGGLKAVGGAASLWLAAENRKSAKKLQSLQNQPATVATQTIPINPMPSTATNNSVGFVPVPPGPVDPTVNANAQRTIAPGASIAPATRDNAGAGYGQRGRSGPGSAPSAIRGGLGAKPGSSTGGASKAEEPAVAEKAPEDPNGDWVGGGGSMNRGGMDLGAGDGGFGNLLGSLGGMLNGEQGPAPGEVNVGDAGRGPASDGQQYSDANGPNGVDEVNTTLFDRVNRAIHRQVQSGQIVNAVNDPSKI